VKALGGPRSSRDAHLGLYLIIALKVVGALIALVGMRERPALKPFPGHHFGSSNAAFSALGSGGSFAFADPDAPVGYYAYAPNRQRSYILDDLLELALGNAFYRCLQNK
jgi:hypothetical protein